MGNYHSKNKYYKRLVFLEKQIVILSNEIEDIKSQQQSEPCNFSDESNSDTNAEFIVTDMTLSNDEIHKTPSMDFSLDLQNNP